MVLRKLGAYLGWGWLLGWALLTSPAQANWGLGVGSAWGQSPYQGVGSNPNTVPALISYRSRFAYIRGLEAGVNVWGQGGAWGGIEASLLVSGRLAGYRSSDSGFLEGMERRGWSLDAGVGLAGRIDAHQFSLQAVHDVLDKHQGYELRGSYRYALPLTEQLQISPGIALYWQSADLVNYYYGVKETEARGDERPPYEAGSGWKPSLSLSLDYAFSPQLSLMTAGRVRKLPDSAASSPLVDRDLVAGVFTALIYRF